LTIKYLLFASFWLCCYRILLTLWSYRWRASFLC